MTDELRSFTYAGVQKFREFLADVKSGAPVQERRDALLWSPVLTDIVSIAGVKIGVSPRQFSDRLEAGKYFVDLFGSVDETLMRYEDKRIWAWLSLYHFDSVCPADKKGRRKVGGIERHIPDPSNFQRYYRHLLYSPFSIYRTYRDNPECAMAMLCPAVDEPGEVVEEFASRQDMITCPAVMEVATKLYVNPQTQQYKPGRGRKTNGGARRLARVLMQFDMTCDLLRIPTEKLLDMLPPEFDEFKP